MTKWQAWQKGSKVTSLLDGTSGAAGDLDPDRWRLLRDRRIRNLVRIKEWQPQKPVRNVGQGRHEEVQNAARVDVRKALQQTLKLRNHLCLRNGGRGRPRRVERKLETRTPNDGKMQDGSEAVRKTGNICDVTHARPDHGVGQRSLQFGGRPEG